MRSCLGAIHFEDRFCTNKKGEIGRGGQVSTQSAMHMAAALAGGKMVLI